MFHVNELAEMAEQSKPAVPKKRHPSGFCGPTPDVGKATQFKPGVSGNPAGRPKKLPVTEIFQELMDEGVTREEIKQSIKRILTSGRMAAVLMLKETAERLEGKVTQPVDATIEGKLAISEIIREVRERKKEYERAGNK